MRRHVLSPLRGPIPSRTAGSPASARCVVTSGRCDLSLRRRICLAVMGEAFSQSSRALTGKSPVGSLSRPGSPRGSPLGSRHAADRSRDTLPDARCTCAHETWCEIACLRVCSRTRPTRSLDPAGRPPGREGCLRDGHPSQAARVADDGGHSVFGCGKTWSSRSAGLCTQNTGCCRDFRDFFVGPHHAFVVTPFRCHHSVANRTRCSGARPH